MKMMTPIEVMKIIDERDEHKLENLARNVFSNKFYHSYYTELSEFILHADAKNLAILIENSLSKSHAKDWEHQIILLIQRIKKEPALAHLNKLIVCHILSKVHSQDFSSEILRKMIAINDVEIHKDIITKVLTTKHAIKWKKVTHVLIEKANPEILELLFKNVFNGPNGKEWSDEETLAHDFLY